MLPAPAGRQSRGTDIELCIPAQRPRDPPTPVAARIATRRRGVPKCRSPRALRRLSECGAQGTRFAFPTSAFPHPPTQVFAGERLSF
jgi:hypothetical protein